MKYFLDTEFLEGSQKKRLFGISYGITNPTIDLISIGIVAEDGREYYAISKDFNLHEAWNRYDLVKDDSVGVRIGCLPQNKKIYWIRENVLKPIFEELREKSLKDKDYIKNHYYSIGDPFNYRHLKELIKWYGKTRDQISEDIMVFVYKTEIQEAFKAIEHNISPIEFYAYYADYDWVAFCWLFGKMIDLPKKFPMYCRDLKQILDERAMRYFENVHPKGGSLKERLESLKIHPDYPKQEKEHNALDDAKWNKELYNFLSNF